MKAGLRSGFAWTAEAFAAMGKQRGSGGLALEARRVSPRRVTVNKNLEHLMREAYACSPY
jgi:hypothetical protein